MMDDVTPEEVRERQERVQEALQAAREHGVMMTQNHVHYP